MKVYRRRIDEHEVANMRDLTSWAEGRVWVSRQGVTALLRVTTPNGAPHIWQSFGPVTGADSGGD